MGQDVIETCLNKQKQGLNLKTNQIRTKKTRHSANHYESHLMLRKVFKVSLVFPPLLYKCLLRLCNDDLTLSHLKYF